MGGGEESELPYPSPPFPLDACNTGCLFTVKGLRMRNVKNAVIHSVKGKKNQYHIHSKRVTT